MNKIICNEYELTEARSTKWRESEIEIIVVESAVPKGALSRVRSQSLRGSPQRWGLVKCEHLRQGGRPQAVTPVCFADAL